MTPAQIKAKELVDKFNHPDAAPWVAITHARRAVESILEELDRLAKKEYTTFVLSSGITSETADGYERLDFWELVKQEIEKL